MRRVVLHVGMHKTGTTSIQASLHKAQDSLAAQGIIYAPLGENHSVGIYDAFTEEGQLHPQHALTDDPEAAGGAPAGAAEANRRRLEEMFRAHPEAQFIISGEGILRLTPDAARRMVRFLLQFVPRIDVVYFVRPPASYIHSQAQQQIRGGMTLERLLSRKFQVGYRRLKKFHYMSPKISFRTHVFSRQTLIDGCAVKTFCQVADLPEVPAIRRNESLSRTAADILLVANEVLPVLGPDGRRNPNRSPRLKNLQLPGPKFFVPEATLRRGLESSQEDIAWVDRTLGVDIRSYDEGETGVDFHAGYFSPEQREALIARAIEENDRLRGKAA